jgi:hypothetical protein
LTRPVHGLYRIDIARTVEGTLWNDLPFLATDMIDLWINNCASMSGVQRLNFVSLLAKLASTHVNKDIIYQISLDLLSSTVEVGRDLRHIEEPDKEDTHRRIRTLDLMQLLKAACAWIKDAGQVLIQLSNSSWNDYSSMIGQDDQKFIESELGKRSPTGCNPWKWMYWLKGLHEIQDEAKESSEKRLVEQATEAVDWMVRNVKDRNSGILRTYQNGGDAFHQDKICYSRKIKYYNQSRFLFTFFPYLLEFLNIGSLYLPSNC